MLQHFSLSHFPLGQFIVVYIDHQLFFTSLKALRETVLSNNSHHAFRHHYEMARTLCGSP